MELFGTPGGPGGPNGAGGKPAAFHLYSMRQAIEERFIMDVLASYTTYSSYYKLANGEVDDPEVDKRKAAAKLAAYVSLHPEHVAQKAAIVVAHLRSHTMKEVGGQGKAMVVCRSRLHALRMWRAIKKHADEHGYGDIGPVVAFSGRLDDPDLGAAQQGLTESRLNGFPESETAQRFALPEHRVLVVADKFQTGFDQPLLHTMFVDKKLASTHAVQTLSRLNRIHPEKAGTFVLDFVNSADDIREAFQPYYESTLVESTDPNLLFDARTTVEAFGVLSDTDVDGFAAAWFTATRADKHAHAALYGHLGPAIERYADLDSDDQEEFRVALNRFVTLYAFLSQILPLSDTAIEKRYAYCRALAARLPKQEVVSVDVEVDLTHLRLAGTGDHAIGLTSAHDPLTAFRGDGTGANYLPGFEPLSAVIERFNEACGLELTAADALHLRGIVTDMVADPAIQQQAGVNSSDSFGNPFDEKFIGAAVDRMKSAEGLTYRILDDDAFQRQVKAWAQSQVYNGARVAYQQHCPIGELLARAEDRHLELKSTLRWNPATQSVSKVLEGVVVKTVAGFLNSPDGGTLLVGVADDGSLVGLAHDYATLHKEGKDDADRFQLHLTQLVGNAVGLAAAANVTTDVHTVDHHDICRVHVQPSGHPVTATVTTSQGRQQRFFVRINNSTRAIEDETEAQRYVAQRWGAPSGGLR
jgi:type I restriction enzyme R subunit